MITLFSNNLKRWSFFSITVIVLISGCSFSNAQPMNKNLAPDNGGLGEKEVAFELKAQEIPLPSTEGVTLFGKINEKGDMITEITVQTKDHSKIFSWTNVTNPTYFPIVNVVDVDDDGKQEIIIISTTGYGTGVNEQEIHVLNMEDLSEQQVENPLIAINEKVTSTITKNAKKVNVIIESNGTKVEKTYNESDAGYWNEKVAFGAIVKYELLGNRIIASVPGAVSPSEFPATALVEYGSDLKVKNIKVIDIQFEDEVKIAELATVWANALKTRDGRPRYEMMSKKVQEKFIQEQINRSGERWNFNIGVSSPWVVDFEINIDGMTATITYVTQTSEPAYYNTREILTFTMENGKLEVDDYQTIFEDKSITH